ncbi:hypothetical protein [Microterricola viridarii]|uniref:hypothetical protein n=1 Tax=Microterricola viridarii TaxID=412690 RepID=UPI0009F5669D|nr:hypothetical protein [Microterricola viridarii]
MLALLSALEVAEGRLARVAAEGEAVRAAYLSFWGAHSSNDLTALGRKPTMPPTPELDILNDGAEEQR